LIDLQVEDAGTCRKRLKIRVPHDDIRAKLDESYETLRESANVPGFRKGHVPRRLLERRFGEQVVEELKQSLMADASSEALEKAKLKALGEPSFESAEFNVDEDFTFEVTVEVEPEFDLGEYKGLKLTRRPVEVSEEEIEAEVRNLLRRLGTYEPVKDAPVAMGDVLTCDWEIVVGEETVLNVPNDRITVAEGLFRDVAAEDVAGRLVGARQGDTVEAKVRIPEDHPVERLRGKEGALRLTLRKVLRQRIPELTQQVAERLDFDSPEEVRQEVRDRLRLRKVQQQREDVERQAASRNGISTASRCACECGGSATKRFRDAWANFVRRAKAPPNGTSASTSSSTVSPTGRRSSSPTTRSRTPWPVWRRPTA